MPAVKSHHILLIIGTALFITGITVASISVFSVTRQVLQGAALINGTVLEPNTSIETVMKGVPSGQRLVLALEGSPQGIPLSAKITGPDGKVLGEYSNINGSRFSTTVTTLASGDQILEVTNAGSKSVKVSGALLGVPVGQPQGGGVEMTPQIQNLVTWGIGILIGGVLFVAGIVLLIIGAVKYFRSGRNKPTTTSSPQT